MPAKLKRRRKKINTAKVAGQRREQSHLWREEAALMHQQSIETCNALEQEILLLGMQGHQVQLTSPEPLASIPIIYRLNDDWRRRR